MRKKMAASLTMFLATVMTAGSAFAKGEDNIFVSGTKSLISDATNWVLGLIPLSAAFFIAWQNYLKKGLEEPAEIAQKDKLIKKILIAAVIGECSVALVKLILSYYNVQVS